MACPINEEELKKLKFFVDACAANPVILNLPQLAFFKGFVEKLGGTVPSGDSSSFHQPGSPPGPQPAADVDSEPDSFSESEPEKIESETESDVDIDNEGCVEPDVLDDSQKMGDVTKTPTEEEQDQASDIRAKANQAYSAQNFEQAISLYTDAILLNPTNALFYAKRGQAFLKLNKPNACIKDCNRALELNCDSAAAYKFRGRANRLLGNWESAAQDLRQACNIDFDEEADEWLREVTPNAKKIEAHIIKQERKKAEKELRERQERFKRAQKANERAQAKANKESKKNERMGGMGGMGGMPFSNPEILEAFRDKEVAAAFQDIMTNPKNIGKYQNNPKVMNLVKLVGQTMGGAGGGGMGGFGMPNFGEGTGTGGAKRSADFQDDGLD